MEDDYELISKQHLKALRDENAKLKLELQNGVKEQQNDNSKLISEILDTIHEESKKERELIILNLNDIKDLNRTTLDNLLSKTQRLDDRFEKIIETMSGLVASLTELISNGPKDEENVNIKELIEKITQLESASNVDIMVKLDEIDSFLKNLRVLLSYVKPNDFVIDKPKLN